jgi:hypothetical protein
MNHSETGWIKTSDEIQVTLDCETVPLPNGHLSVTSIRSYLETLALANQRVVAEFTVDGFPVDPSLPLENLSFRRVDAITVTLNEFPLLLLATARRQVERVRASVDTALTLVLINPPATARELWWKIASQLKDPILTLSLMPEHLCQNSCGTTFHKLRRWQLEQISVIVRRVDQACDLQDNFMVSDALEKLVLPWLDQLGEQVRLWQAAMQAGARLGLHSGNPNAR